ncbi:MAG: CPBP family intramembrane glutamic endopeptidase [Candidatus Korobacteraceae bacterium]
MFTTDTGKLQPVWAFIFSGILSAIAFVVSGHIAADIVGQRPFVFEIVFRPLLSLLLLGIFIWMLTVGDHIEDHRIAAQGLPRVKGCLKHFAIGTAIGFLLTLLAVIPIHFWGHTKIAYDHGLMIVPKVAAVIVILLFSALAEELMFRGYPFQHLVKGIGAAGAIAVFSVLYGLLHLKNPGAGRWGVINTILIGILLSIAYLRTRSLWLPWGIHFGWNATLGSILGLPVSGFRFFNVYARTTATGPWWVTGGNYGVEASGACAIAVLVGILIMWKLPLGKLSPTAGLLSPKPPLRGSLSHTKG